MVTCASVHSMSEKTTKSTPRIARPASASNKSPDALPIVGPCFFHARRDGPWGTGATPIGGGADECTCIAPGVFGIPIGGVCSAEGPAGGGGDDESDAAAP